MRRPVETLPPRPQSADPSIVAEEARSLPAPTPRRSERLPLNERERYRKRQKQLAPLRRLGRQLWTGLRVTFAVAVAWSLVLLAGLAALIYQLIQWLAS